MNFVIEHLVSDIRLNIFSADRYGIKLDRDYSPEEDIMAQSFQGAINQGSRELVCAYISPKVNISLAVEDVLHGIKALEYTLDLLGNIRYADFQKGRIVQLHEFAKRTGMELS